MRGCSHEFLRIITWSCELLVYNLWRRCVFARQIGYLPRNPPVYLHPPHRLSCIRWASALSFDICRSHGHRRKTR